MGERRQFTREQLQRNGIRLTRREFDVFQYLVHLVPHKTIAVMLGIKHQTARIHACSVMRKFGLSGESRFQLLRCVESLRDNEEEAADAA